MQLQDDCIFLQNNDSKHNAYNTKQWTLYNVPYKLEISPQSPDTNVVEHL